MASYQQKRMVEEVVANCHVDEKQARKILQKAKWNLPRAYHILIGENSESGKAGKVEAEDVHSLLTSTITKNEPLPRRLLTFVWTSLIRNLRLVAIWSVLFGFFIYCEFGTVFAICSGLYFMFWCTGTRSEGEMSAYSVFNKNYEALPGAFESQKMDSFAMWG